MPTGTTTKVTEQRPTPRRNRSRPGSLSKGERARLTTEAWNRTLLNYPAQSASQTDIRQIVEAKKAAPHW